MALITAHITECTQARVDTKEAIKSVRDLLVAFIAAVGVVLVGFSGYTYVNSQTLAQKLEESHQQTQAAIEQIPSETARQVGVIQDEPKAKPEQ